MLQHEFDDPFRERGFERDVYLGGVVLERVDLLEPGVELGLDDALMGCASDVWAFGIMLFEALTGQHPVKGVFSLEPHEIFINVMRDGLPSPSDILKDVPTSLDHLCRRMLNRDLTVRMRTLGEFIDEVTEYLKARGRTVAQFGTFAQPAKTKTAPDGEPWLDGRRHQEMAELRNANAALRLENERFREKAEILAEIAELGLFSGRRKRQLWGQLARL